MVETHRGARELSLQRRTVSTIIVRVSALNFWHSEGIGRDSQMFPWYLFLFLFCTAPKSNPHPQLVWIANRGPYATSPTALTAEQFLNLWRNVLFLLLQIQRELSSAISASSFEALELLFFCCHILRVLSKVAYRWPLWILWHQAERASPQICSRHLLVLWSGSGFLFPRYKPIPFCFRMDLLTPPLSVVARKLNGSRWCFFDYAEVFVPFLKVWWNFPVVKPV